MVKLELNADGRRWNVVKGDDVVSTHATIKEANDAKFELRNVKAPVVRYWKQDGSEVTKQPRRRA
jgi:hypothetical protein